MEISKGAQEYFKSTIYNFFTKTSRISFIKVNRCDCGKPRLNCRTPDIGSFPETTTHPYPLVTLNTEDSFTRHHSNQVTRSLVIIHDLAHAE